MPELSTIVAMVLVVAMAAYVLSGGADFGGGIWRLFAWGPRGERQRDALNDAIAPIWEANHVWLILVIVLLFSCFPRAFSVLMTALHIPLAAMLVGIVLRGSAFAFESYPAGATRLQKRSGRVFAVSSAVTPFLLGISVGAIASGNLRVDAATGMVQTNFVSEWLAPFPFAIGALLLAVCAFLSAVYMTVEVRADVELANDFRRRGLWAAVAVGVFALVSLLLARRDAPFLYEGLVHGRAAIFFQTLTGLAAVIVLGALWQRRYRLARVAALVQGGLIIVGWALAQFPYLIYPDITIAGAAADEVVLRLVLIALAAGSVLLLPAFYYLYRVFKAGKSGGVEVAQNPATVAGENGASGGADESGVDSR